MTTIIFIIFHVKLGIMVLLRRFIPHPNTLIEVSFDSTLLVVLLCPSSYYFMMRPMEREIAIHEQAEMDFQKANDQLESRVKQCTAELESANFQLEAEITKRKRSEERIAATLFGLMNQNLAHKILWAKIEYIGIVSMPLAVLVYVLYHSGSNEL